MTFTFSVRMRRNPVLVVGYGIYYWHCPCNRFTFLSYCNCGINFAFRIMKDYVYIFFNDNDSCGLPLVSRLIISYNLSFLSGHYLRKRASSSVFQRSLPEIVVFSFRLIHLRLFKNSGVFLLFASLVDLTI